MTDERAADNMRRPSPDGVKSRAPTVKDGTPPTGSMEAGELSAVWAGPVPDAIGNYRVSREIGRGGMGVVYVAHDTRLDRPVAIKFLPDAVALDGRRRSRFEREARLLALINHPNLAAIHAIEEVEGRLYLISHPRIRSRGDPRRHHQERAGVNIRNARPGAPDGRRASRGARARSHPPRFQTRQRARHAPGRGQGARSRARQARLRRRRARRRGGARSGPRRR